MIQHSRVGGELARIAVIALAGATCEIEEWPAVCHGNPAPLDQGLPPFRVGAIPLWIGPVNRTTRLNQNIGGLDAIIRRVERKDRIDASGGAQ